MNVEVFYPFVVIGDGVVLGLKKPLDPMTHTESCLCVCFTGFYFTLLNE